MIVFYAYFLGLWLIGPFDSMAACQDARRWQMTQGGATDVDECWAVIDTHGMVRAKGDPSHATDAASDATKSGR